MRTLIRRNGLRKASAQSIRGGRRVREEAWRGRRARRCAPNVCQARKIRAAHPGTDSDCAGMPPSRPLNDTSEWSRTSRRCPVTILPLGSEAGVSPSTNGDFWFRPARTWQAGAIRCRGSMERKPVKARECSDPWCDSRLRYAKAPQTCTFQLPAFTVQYPLPSRTRMSLINRRVNAKNQASPGIPFMFHYDSALPPPQWL